MYAHTVALSVGFDIQRQAIESSQRALETTIDIQTNLTDSTIDTVSRQEDVQRRLLALQHVAIHRLLDRAGDQQVGVVELNEHLRSVTDDQFSSLYDGHKELFETLTTDLEASAAALDEVSMEYLDAIDELATLTMSATEQAETQLSGESPTC